MPNNSIPVVSSILHPSDFSETSKVAFAYSLAIALRSKSSLTLLHVESEQFKESDWELFPSVMGTLENWGILAAGTPKDEVFSRLGVMIKKVEITAGNPVSAIIDYMSNHPIDLIVLASHKEMGLERWTKPSVSEPVSRHSNKITLFIPDESRGFISLNNGNISLKKVLIPIDKSPNPRPAINFAVNFVKALTSDPVEIKLLHIGEESAIKGFDRNFDEQINLSVEVSSGKVHEEINRISKEFQADLIVMATHGHEGFLDMLRGSTTEQVLRLSGCPVLAVPSV
ncbi:MAG: universal stress protein [Candidatus Dadabacteria bacterium]|nr:universal stress protein [Candidatus Dadabacteria bacterium]NIS08760.1 universal stress protein [Candidatus Dadabacteria bacterium]NIV42703.1 universal stress protein [Candidatus Dadabacteria bacterium]NIX15446.1 universal stress protein [Candidatus Dadabacteria bacterium]NIY22108.1 universal stress protein [Candidatus Dadabacteria bacterium]